MRRPALLLLIATMLAPFTTAQAETPPNRPLCHDYKELVAQLGSRYEEQPVSLGVQANGDLLQVFSSSRLRTWTILSVSPNGTGCIVAAGRSWESFDTAKADPEA